MFIETCVLLLLPYVYMSLYTADKQYYTADLSAKLYSPSAYYTAKVCRTYRHTIVGRQWGAPSVWGSKRYLGTSEHPLRPSPLDSRAGAPWSPA
jgi:hypothetical protein